MATIIAIFAIANYLVSLVVGFKEGKIEGAFAIFGILENQERKYYVLLLIILPVSLIFIIAFKSAFAEVGLLNKLISGTTHGISALVIAVLYIMPLYALTFISGLTTGKLIKELSQDHCDYKRLFGFLLATLFGIYVVYKALKELLKMVDPYPLIF